MKISRDFYLEKLIAAKGDGYVKVVTGIRRCGKSYLLFTLFKGHLLSSGVKESRIVEIALDSDEFEGLRDPRKLSAYVRAKVARGKGTYYVLIDEIQMCEEAPSVVEGSESKITFYDVLRRYSRRRMRLGVITLRDSSRPCISRTLSNTTASGMTLSSVC